MHYDISDGRHMNGDRPEIDIAEIEAQIRSFGLAAGYVVADAAAAVLAADLARILAAVRATTARIRAEPDNDSRVYPYDE